MLRSWMAMVGGGYTFANVAWQPRLGLSYDYASGDEDPTDGVHQTFNQLFPLGHAWLGYLDRVGRSNVHAIRAQLKVKPCKRVVAWADQLASAIDYLHEHDLAHGSVCPDNVIIDEHDAVTLAGGFVATALPRGHDAVARRCFVHLF